MRVAADDTWADVFSRVLVEKIEPHLGLGRATILCEYPVTEAALARPIAARSARRRALRTLCLRRRAGQRFGELTDPVEQRRRFEAEMAEKQRVYGERYPIDEDFLAALARHAGGVAAARSASTGWSCWRPAPTTSSRCSGRRRRLPDPVN